MRSRQLLVQCQGRTKPNSYCRQLNSSVSMISSGHSRSAITMTNRPGVKRATNKVMNGGCKNRSSSSALTALTGSRQQVTKKESKRVISQSFSSSSAEAEVAATTTAEVVQPPTREQLKHVFIHASIPMIGFGLMDQTVMIQAGNAIDCTIGVIFSLSRESNFRQILKSNLSIF